MDGRGSPNEGTEDDVEDDDDIEENEKVDRDPKPWPELSESFELGCENLSANMLRLFLAVVKLFIIPE